MQRNGGRQTPAFRGNHRFPQGFFFVLNGGAPSPELTSKTGGYYCSCCCSRELIKAHLKKNFIVPLEI